MGETITQSLRWEQLAPVVVGQKLEVELVNGGRAEGVGVSVEPEVLVLQVRSTGGKNTQVGQSAIPREEIRGFRVRGGEGHPWWGAFIAAPVGLGVGAAVFRGDCVRGWFGSSCTYGARDVGGILGLTGGAALVGALIGKHTGHWEMRITLLPDAPKAEATQ